MLEWLAQRMEVSTTVAGILVALIVVQLSLQLWGLADLARRDAVRGGKKWVWALVIAFGNVVGAIVYLVIGRVVPGADVPGAGSRASTAGGDAAKRAVDTLYGGPDRR